MSMESFSAAGANERMIRCRVAFVEAVVIGNREEK